MSQQTSSDAGSTISNQPVKVAAPLKLDILRIIRISQQQHGLRHGDYQRYRSFCSRRLRRIRKSLELTYGNHKKFQKPVITDELVAKDSRYLLLPLICSERAWAYAMQLKSESNTEPRKKFHLLNRLRKAVKHAEQLEALCNQQKTCDARTKLEVQAYTAVMSGHLKFEMQAWNDALQFYIRAQTIYDKLKIGVRNEDDKQMFDQRIDEITTNARFCQYKSGDKNAARELRNLRTKAALDDPEMTRVLDAFLSETHEQQTSSISEITWRQRKIQVTNEKVRLFFLNLQEFQAEIKKPDVLFDTKMSLYESFLKEAVETLQIVKDELKNDPTFKPIPVSSSTTPRDNNEKLSDGVWLYSYIAWIRLSKMIERNLAMIDNGKQQIFKANPSENEKSDATSVKKITKPADIVRMYDLLLQFLNDILAIPALQNDKTIQSDVAFQTIVYKACRSFYIAISFVQQKRYKESAALVNKSEIYMEQAKKTVNDGQQPKSSEINYQSLLNEFTFIQSKLDEVKYQIQTSATSTPIGSASPKVGTNQQSFDEVLSPDEQKELEKKPLIDRLDTYFEDLSLTNKNHLNIVSLPPPFKPIPCKPVLFDLALNHLTFPSLDDKVQSKRQVGSANPDRGQQQQAGLTGFVKGFFSWGSKNQ
jgi:signal recognition particle subunit SRP68